MNQRVPHHLKPLWLWGLNCKQVTICIQQSHISHVLYIPLSNLSYFRFFTQGDEHGQTRGKVNVTEEVEEPIPTVSPMNI